jgi:hypothetical protein
MSTMRTLEMERMFHEGMDHLREARWEEAIGIFTRLREMGVADPELDKILAEAQLKAEIARSAMPTGALPPTPQRIPSTQMIIGLGGILLLVLIVIIALVRLAPAAPTAIVPTATVLPQPERPTPFPAQLSQPTAPKTSTLLVRMASGQNPIQTSPNIEIILDASGSMLAKIEDTIKIDIAHNSLDTLIQSLPDNTNIALRTYGRQRTNDCNDLELVAPFAPLERTSFMEKIRGIRPVDLSRTPMEQSIREVAQDVNGITSDILVIFVSDGDETCGGDPAKAAADLHATHPNLRISVIGFAIGPDEWKARLGAIAAQGGGSYFDAADAKQLAEALQQAVQMTYRVIDTQGHEVFSGPVGTAAESLPIGEYTIEVGGAIPFRVERVRISGKQTTIELRQRNGVYVSHILRQ